ncbi:ATP-binding cassette domain-containing protein [Sphingomonas sp. G-3-2-10]|uniref:ATP-binding cassette domain-containing protein n=1 Tax=Sphingomonas sp. G-3-2-10 TaxID=2728838 RepID=UPI00146C9560|nr:ATP-binding cassette domain-containing protein [Sphingomonas sp. G-3-2-10]NML05129.1 ATP-binding cassette domain-containing protein [Sphingomonas sp. G-3-2-10]
MTNAVEINGLIASVGGDVKISIPLAEFRRGSLHLLVGPNGSGKSSIMRALLGFVKASQGTINWEFADSVESFGASKAVSPKFYQNIGYVQQGSDSLWPQHTAAQHVELALRAKTTFREIDKNDMEKKVLSVLKRAEVAKINWDKRPDHRSIDGHGTSVSGGERQRIAYARAIAGDPEVLLFDELEASLDANVRGQFIDRVLRDFLNRDKHHTAFVVTHDPVNWLVGEWAPGDRQIWRISKSGSQEITIARDKDSEMPGLSVAQATVAHGGRLGRTISNLPVGEVRKTAEWCRVGAELAWAIHDFIHPLLGQPKAIITVVTANRESGTPDIEQPILLSAVGPKDYAPDGLDKNDLAPFLNQVGAFHTKRSPVPNPPPILAKGLITVLLHAGMREAYKGARLDQVAFEGVTAESFLFSTNTEGEGAKSGDSYLELSRSTKAVYLFRAIRESDDARIVVGIDFIDERVLDPYQCYFVMQALEHALVKLRCLEVP